MRRWAVSHVAQNPPGDGGVDKHPKPLRLGAQRTIAAGRDAVVPASRIVVDRAVGYARVTDELMSGKDLKRTVERARPKPDLAICRLFDAADEPQPVAGPVLKG